MAGSKMIEEHIKNLKQLKGKQVEAGWFETARYPAAEGKEGIQVARVARIQEYGGTIDHPGGTKYITDAATKDRFLGTRFVRNDFEGDHEVTNPHKIEIPARPFMRLAWLMFLQQRSSIQKAIANKMANGEISAEEGLAQIGMALENCIAQSIKNGNWQTNAPSTVRKKGFNKPLIDSAHMLQSISSKVT
jgi:hypothetical protein